MVSPPDQLDYSLGVGGSFNQALFSGSMAITVIDFRQHFCIHVAGSSEENFPADLFPNCSVCVCVCVFNRSDEQHSLTEF